MGYTAATGMNLGPDNARYEAGDKVPDALVADWMVEEGVVSGKPSKPKSSTGGE